MKTRVVHCRLAEHDIYIGRPSVYGNPYSYLEGTPSEFKVASHGEAVDKYRLWLPTQPHIMAKLPELKGKVLGCWCRPFKRCHGDVLAEFADAIEDTHEQP